MKLFKHHIDSDPSALILMWAIPLLLIVPNICLDITENYTSSENAANILLPLGIYYLLMASCRRTGITTLCFLPVMVLAAFQIVLLFLYGQSIIAVDMFLNVMTTNVREATELLRNLSIAIAVVCALYLPPIVLAIISLVRKARIGKELQHTGLLCGGGLTVAGVVALLFCLFQAGGYAPDRRLFPVNVINNMFIAGERTEDSKTYFEKSDKFRFNATDTRPDEGPEVYILVIGETSRADNWQLGGYGRSTNPRLSKREGLVFYRKALSESNTTHKSVPLLMSHLRADQFGDSIYCSRGIIDAFNEAGFSTVWISNQNRNNSLIDFFGSRANTHRFLTDDGRIHHDMELCGQLKAELDTLGEKKILIVLHTYGSHFNYKERYPAEYARFLPEHSAEASSKNREGLVNAYDNTILYTDAVLDSIMGIAEQGGRPAALVYLADHGEDIFDDSRKRFLHASPTPTYWQLHVPMIVWMSAAYRSLHPEEYEAARRAEFRDVSSSRSAFHTLADMAGLAMPELDPSASLVSPFYKSPERFYVNDYNEGVRLTESGLEAPDFEHMRRHGISAH